MALHGRQQYVSDLENVNFGVPHGYILGPCLFVISLNDIFQFIYPNTYISYADDMSPMSSHNVISALETLYTESLDKAISWFLTNNLPAEWNEND